MRYLVVTYLQQPNGKYNESVTVEAKVSKRSQQFASVILDYRRKQVVKMRFNGNAPDDERSFDKLNDFYKKHYGHLILNLEKEWAVLHENIDKLVDAVEALETDLEDDK